MPFSRTCHASFWTLRLASFTKCRWTFDAANRRLSQELDGLVVVLQDKPCEKNREWNK